MMNSFNIWSILRMLLLVVVLLHFLDSGVEAGKKKRRNKSKRHGEREMRQESKVKVERKAKRKRGHKRINLGNESVEKSWSVPTLVQLFDMHQARGLKKEESNLMNDSTKLRHLKPMSSVELLERFRKEKEEDLDIIPVTSAPKVPSPPKAKVDFFIHRPKSRRFFSAPASTISAVTSSELGFVTVHSASGKYGVHSRSHKVFGRLIHVSDAGRVDSHFGCGSNLANKDQIPPNDEPWVALIARGHCSFFMKIKIAEQYNATAAIIYDHKSGEVPEMFTLGTRIVSLAISKKDGHKMARLSDSGTKVMVNIEVDDSDDTTTEDNEGDRSEIVSTMPTSRDVALIARMQTKDNGGNGASNFSQSGMLIFLFTLLALLNQHHMTC